MGITFRHVPFLVISCLLLAADSLQALVIQGAGSTNIYDRFSSGYPSNPVENNSFFAGAENFQGVGWNSSNANQSFALITPQHIIGANHFTPGVGATIDFFSAGDTVISRTVSSLTTVQNGGSDTDVFVAQLDSPLSGVGVPYFRFPSDIAINTLVSRSITTYGFTAQAGSNTIASRDGIAAIAALGGNQTELANTPTFEFIYDSNTSANGQARVEVGDSGSPTFIEEMGELTIVGTHSALAQAGTTYTTGDADVTRLIPEINNAIDSLGSTGFQVEQVPEPSAFLFILLGALPLCISRRRSQTRG